MDKKPSHLPYVLITPARNESAYIAKTLESMMQQTMPPLKWVIVNDGSTDQTGEIIEPYLAKCPWLEMVQLPVRRDRSFAGKVYAFNAGFERVKGLPYAVIGNLDGDTSFEKDQIGLLETGETLGWEQKGNDLEIRLPNLIPIKSKVSMHLY